MLTTDLEGITGSGSAVSRTITMRLNTDYDFVADKNTLYVRDGLYYTGLDKESVIRDFSHLFLTLERNDYQSKYGKEAFEVLGQLNYSQNVDVYSDIVPFANGIYFSPSANFSTETEDYQITTYLPFDYVEEPQCPMFLRAIEEILPDEPDRTYFLTFMNYALSTSIQQQVALILKGGGNNGKTALMEFFIRLMGNRATTAKINKLNDDNVRCNLKGKTLCYSSEIGGDDLNQDLMEHIKETITEKYKSGRRAYEKLEEWENTTKFVCATNHLPKIHSYERAFLRRFKIIHFPTDFTGREDRTLFDRIYEQEAGDVLSYILQNYSDWNILTVDWHETEYIWRNNSNPVLRFVNEECIEYADRNSETNLVYNQYIMYCVNEGFVPLSRKYFNTQMTKLGHQPIKLNYDKWVFNGIKLKVEAVIE